MHHMRDSANGDRQLWAHVLARYIATEQRLTRVPVVRTRQGPVPLPPARSEVDLVISMHGRKAHVRLLVWSPRVDERLVRLGIERLAELMYGGDHGRVVLPPYLRGRAAVAVRPDGQPSQGTAAHAERIGLRERPSGPRAGDARCDDNAMTHTRGERQGIPVFGLGDRRRMHSPEERLERALAGRLGQSAAGA